MEINNSNFTTTLQSNFPTSLFLGFNFYGAGNIGDDLMLEGFLNALSIIQPNNHIKIRGLSNWDLKSQRLRFPSISWLTSSFLSNKKNFDNLEYECWAGVGDTPYQYTNGDWFLKFIMSQLDIIKKFKFKIMVNIGAESEIEFKREEFRNISYVFDKISTRDIETSRILVDFLDYSKKRIFTGADLANISLFNILNKHHIKKENDLGLIIAGDTLSNSDIIEIEKFVETSKDNVMFNACETRYSSFFEIGVYKELTKKPWSKIKRNTILKVPSYEKDSLIELIRPICLNDTVISSRYHGLLIASWAGCKVAAIGRSSKIFALTDELQIPICDLPVTREKLEYLRKNAKAVSRNILTGLKDKAIDGVNYALRYNS